MIPVIELEITKISRGYRYRIIDSADGTRPQVVTYTSDVRSSALDEIRAHLADTAKLTGGDAAVRALGRLIHNLIVHPVPDIEKFLKEHRGPLFISTDDPEMPLELLHDGDDFLGLRLPIGRGVIWDERIAMPATNRVGPLSILIIADPTDDLPGARAEAEALIRILPADVNFKFLQGQEASFVSILRELAEGSYHIVHYAGHIGIRQRDNAAYLELSAGGSTRTGQILASEIANNLHGNPFVFLNGCRSSGVVSGVVAGYTENLARAFIRGGVGGVVGTLWDIPDGTAGVASLRFYEEFLAGQTAGEALRLARMAARDAYPNEATWAAPVLYGNPVLRIATENPLRHTQLEDSAQVILDMAAEEAYRTEHTAIGTPHLFLAFARKPDGVLAGALAQLGFSTDGLRMLVRQSIVPGLHGTVASAEAVRGVFTDSVQRVLQAARTTTEHDAAQAIDETQLLVAFFTKGLGSISHLLKRVGLDPALVLRVVRGQPVVTPPPAESDRTPSIPERIFKPDGQLNTALFDSAVRQSLAISASEAEAAGSALGTPQLVIGWLEFPTSLLATLLVQQGLQPGVIAALMRSGLGYERFTASPGSPEITVQACSARVRHILALSDQIAQRENAAMIGERHLLIAFMQDGGGNSAQTLARMGVNWTAVAVALQHQATAPARTSILTTHGRDLTDLARQGKLSPIVGRKRVLEQIVHILSKDARNNPLLVGDAGVGKTAVVEALAQHIASGQVPTHLRKKRLIEVSLGSLVAGTRYRGDFEERLQQLVEEVRTSADVLIFIDEIHTLIGAGDSAGQLDAANILKPALARGELHCIGATTPAEYQKSIAQDEALRRRFQQVLVEELSPEETLDVLKAVRSRFEIRYGVKIQPSAMETAIRLSVQYVPEQRLPDKARDVLEEACVNEGVGTMGQWGVEATEEDTLKLHTIDPEAVARVIAHRKGLPVEQLTAGEQQHLMELESRLKTRVIGQDEAVSAVARAVRLARTNLKEPGRTSGVFMFVGPTGVGKTELAKALACELFGSEAGLIRFDMSEYMEPHSVARLIGAPPGYVGYLEEGQLVKELQRKPYSIVLLDEIEKAAPQIFDLFLQLFDEGRLTDAHHNQVDGRHAMYIMTSNVDVEGLNRPQVGFNVAGGGRADPNPGDAVRRALRGTFRPEFLNRIDEIVLFNRLEPEHIRQIAMLQIDALRSRIESDHGIQLEVTPEAVDLICEQGYDPTYGARPLRQAIRRLLATPLSELLLTHAAEHVVACVEGAELVLKTE